MIPKEFLGAFKAGHRSASRPFIDEDLANELLHKVLKEGCEESRKALKWLSKFNNEFHKNVIKKHDDTSLHCTEDLRKDCYARENSRNRDIWNKVEILPLDGWTPPPAEENDESDDSDQED